MAIEHTADKPRPFMTRREVVYAAFLSLAAFYGVDKITAHPDIGEKVPLPLYVSGTRDASILDLPGLPESFSEARLETHRLTSGLAQALHGKYVPIVDSGLNINRTMEFAGIRLALLNNLPEVINPNNPNTTDKTTRRMTRGLVYYENSIALSAVPLNGVSSNLLVVNAMRMSDGSGLQDAILIDKWSGVIKGSIPSVYPKSTPVEFRTDGENLGLFINGRQTGFDLYSSYNA